MKGQRKRKAFLFKNNNIPYNKGLRSASSAMTTSLPRSIRRADPSAVLCASASTSQYKDDVLVLRPKPEKEKNTTNSAENDFEGNRIIDNNKMMEAVNDCSQKHQQNSDCSTPYFVIHSNVKWGLAWKYTFRCANCDFISAQYKFYKEIETRLPGPNAAMTNVSFQVGLQDTPIGNTRARLLIASANIPPPAKSSMQKTANKVALQTVKLNKADMDNKLTMLGHTLSDLGLSGDIHGSFDGRYNSITIVSASKPGQNSSQAIGVFAESMTENHYIIDCEIENKLCYAGARLRSQGVEVNCPGGHPDCTATIPNVAPHSEYEMAKCIASRLAQKGIKVSVLTTDQDAKAQNGFADAYRALFPDHEIKRQKDPVHMGRSQARKCMNTNFSSDMFAGCGTREATNKAKKVFGVDVKSRCSLIVKKVMELYCGDLPRIIKAVHKALKATVLCYSGDCGMCRRNSFVCGGGQKTCWFERSAFLGPHNITTLRMTETDKVLLEGILRMRLSEESLKSTMYNYSTQSVESFNASLSKSAPKNVNFSRNYSGRCASAVLRHNNGQSGALLMKLHHMGIVLSKRPEQAINKIGADMRRHRVNAKSEAYRKRRLERRGKMESRHRWYTKQKNNRQSDYVKERNDHSYQKPS